MARRRGFGTKTIPIIVEKPSYSYFSRAKKYLGVICVSMFLRYGIGLYTDWMTKPITTKEIPLQQAQQLLVEIGYHKADINRPQLRQVALHNRSSYREGRRAYELQLIFSGVNYQRVLYVEDNGSMDGIVDKTTLDTVVENPSTIVPFKEPMQISQQFRDLIGQKFFDKAAAEFNDFVRR